MHLIVWKGCREFFLQLFEDWWFVQEMEGNGRKGCSLEVVSESYCGRCLLELLFTGSILTRLYKKLGFLSQSIVRLLYLR